MLEKFLRGGVNVRGVFVLGGNCPGGICPGVIVRGVIVLIPAGTIQDLINSLDVKTCTAI